jgi:hypothetical protein
MKWPEAKKGEKMAIFASPTSVRALNDYFSPSQVVATAAPHSSHPSFFHLVLLVFEAVLEVVCVSLPGYIAARQGMFDADAQKLVANLNVMLVTPCLGSPITLVLCQIGGKSGTDSFPV